MFLKVAEGFNRRRGFSDGRDVTLGFACGAPSVGLSPLRYRYWDKKARVFERAKRTNGRVGWVVTWLEIYRPPTHGWTGTARA